MENGVGCGWDKGGEVHGLTVVQQDGDLFRQELQRETEKDVLLCDLGQRPREDARYVVVYPEALYVFFRD